ncbi:MAG: ATP-dependent dethiobiotin synthetase BioD, partial [Panacagrimonas sp.]
MPRPTPATTITVFLTGTDTGVGKTRVATSLVRAARGLGIAACGYKPVASGCRRGAQGLRNAEARALLRAAGLGADAYARVNPYAFAPAIAPHLA